MFGVPTRNVTAKKAGQQSIFIFMLFAVVLVMVGCSAGQGDTQTPVPPTPTLPSLSMPTVESTPVSKEGEGLVPPTPTVVTAPTFDPNDPMAATAQAYSNEQATAYAEQVNIPGPVQTNEATVQPVGVPITTAWGSLLGTNKVPLSLDSGHMFIFHSADPDGKFVLGVILPAVMGYDQQVDLVLVDVRNGHTTKIASYTGPSVSDITYAPHTFGSDTDGEWVVWNDKTSIYAYNLKTGATKMLFTKPIDANWSYAPSLRPPKVDHGIAVWAEQVYTQYSATTGPTHVMMADLATGKVTELSSKGNEPVIGWPYAGWVEYPKSGQGVNELTVMHKGVITLLNLQTAQKITLTNVIDAASFGLSAKDSTLVYTRTSGQAFITDFTGSSPRLISGDFSGPYNSISLNDRLVVWVFSSYPVAYDRAQDRRVFLEGTPNGTGWVGMRVVKGHILAWQASTIYLDLEAMKESEPLPNDQFVYLVDTNLLPR